MRPRAAVAGLALGLAILAAATVMVQRADSSPAPGSGPAGPSAAPHVLPFAQLTHGSPGHRQARRGGVQVREGLDGCDHAYGRADQCVPWRLPRGIGDACAWLRSRGFGPLAIHRRDRHRLDRDHDGVACGPGDAAPRRHATRPATGSAR